MKCRKLKISIASLLSALCILLSSCGLFIIEYKWEGEFETNEKSENTDIPPKDTEISNDESSNTNTEKPKSEADKAKERLDAMQSFDFGGQSFIIATTSSMTFATEGDSYYDRVLLLRDSLVEKKYNIKIVTFYADSESIAKELRASALAEDYYADLISVPQYMIGSLAKERLIMNLRSLPFYSYKTDYSDSTAAAAGNRIYADIGAASSDFSKIYAVMFNRNAAESLGYNIDALVSEGSWTWDIFDKISREATEKLGIIGQGSAYMGDEYTDILLRSANFKLVDNTLGRVPEISFDSPELESIVEVTCSLIYKNPASYKPVAGTTEADFLQSFAEGNMLFALTTMSSLSELSVSNIDWGVAPIPKMYGSASRYFAYTDASANVLAVPAENNKLDVTGAVIGGLNAASYSLLAEEYKTSCLYDYLRDEKALRSFDQILESMTFDFSTIYASGTAALAGATYGAVREARTSKDYYATDLINERSEEANAELKELFGEKVFDLLPPADTDSADTQ